MTTNSQSTSYETESKVDMKELREAVRKVFAYDPPASRKDSVDPQAVKHRERARKGSKHPVRP